MKTREIYSLNGLPPEVIAVAFAKTSRSPESFKQIAASLSEEGASKFHEKWVVGYGHSSVAEAAILHIAIENVSMLAAKAIEDNRLASYTEKSTRYQLYDNDAYYVPEKILGTKLEVKYRSFVELLFEKYNLWHSELKKQFLSNGDVERVATSKACDAIRGILPIGTLTNLGMTINARSLCHTIKKLKGSKIEEVQAIGNQLELVGREQVPTLMRHLDPYSIGWDVTALLQNNTIEYKNSVSRIELSNIGYCLSVPMPEWKAWDPIPEIFETGHAQVQMLYPFTTYRDLQRHRMCYHQMYIPSLTTFVVPRGVAMLGMEAEYHRLICKCTILTRELHRVCPNDMIYHVPMHIRVSHNIFCNLRELLHILILRTRPNGDPEYVELVKDIETQFSKSLPQSKTRDFIERLLTESRDVRQAKNKEVRVDVKAT